MKTQFRAVGLVVVTVIILLSAAKRARADAFSFTFATDPVGCSFTGNCSGVINASGTFTTGPLSPISGFPGTLVYPVTSIAGQMNGFAMSLIAGSNGAIWQPTPGQAVFGLFPFSQSNLPPTELSGISSPTVFFRREPIVCCPILAAPFLMT